MATLREEKRKGGGIYVVDFRYQGKRYRTSTKTSDRKLAELFLKDIEVKIAKGKFAFEEVKRKEVTLSEFTEKFLQFSKANKAKNTFYLDRYVLGLLKGIIGDLSISRIRTDQIEGYKVKRLETVKPASINLEIRHLKAAFEVAVRWGYTPQNPLKGIKQIKIKNSNLPKFFSKEEVNRLMDTIPSGRFKDLIYFYLYTGCRREEGLNLKWDDIDMSNRQVTIRETKAGINRIIPFNGELLKTLSAINRDEDRPFTFKGNFVTHKFKKYLRASQIDKSGTLKLHSLRHTYASHLVMAGVDILTVSKLLGHSSVKVTEMYAHLVPDHLRASVERLRY